MIYTPVDRIESDGLTNSSPPPKKKQLVFYETTDEMAATKYKMVVLVSHGSKAMARDVNSFSKKKNKHTVSIAEGIHVPYRPQQISIKLDLYYVKTNPYMKFQVNMSKDEKEKSGKRNSSKGNNSCKSRSNATKVEVDLYYVKTNSYMKF